MPGTAVPDSSARKSSWFSCWIREREIEDERVVGGGFGERARKKKKKKRGYDVPLYAEVVLLYIVILSAFCHHPTHRPSTITPMLSKRFGGMSR